jgi:hypothetical protein
LHLSVHGGPFLARPVYMYSVSEESNPAALFDTVPWYSIPVNQAIFCLSPPNPVHALRSRYIHTSCTATQFPLGQKCAQLLLLLLLLLLWMSVVRIRALQPPPPCFHILAGNRKVPETVEEAEAEMGGVGYYGKPDPASWLDRNRVECVCSDDGGCTDLGFSCGCPPTSGAYPESSRSCHFLTVDWQISRVSDIESALRLRLTLDTRSGPLPDLLRI